MGKWSEVTRAKKKAQGQFDIRSDLPRKGSMNVAFKMSDFKKI